MYGIGEEPVLPDPSGAPLTLTVRCHTDPSHKRGQTHPILLHPDWSVDTGHDLEAERCAVALGGYLSCLELETSVVPAVRAYVQRQLRRELPEIELAAGARWSLTTKVNGCCAGPTSHGSAALAAEHWRGARHVATQFGARQNVVKDLGQQVLWTYGMKADVGPPHEARGLVKTCVRTRADLDLLWQAGLTPELIAYVHAEVGNDRPLPANFYLGVLSKRPDLKWIHDSAAQTPERDVHEWLAWTETDNDRAHPTIRGEWLQLGISLRDVAVLSGSPYVPADVVAFAHGIRRTTTAAGAVLASWVKAECAPTIPALTAVCTMSDCQPDVVTKAAVDVVEDLIGMKVPREHLAFALTLCGAPSIAASVIHATNSFDPADLLQGLNDWEQARQNRNRVHA